MNSYEGQEELGGRIRYRVLDHDGRVMATTYVQEDAIRLVAALNRRDGPSRPLLAFLEFVERMHSGGAFDLTDSPKSYMANVKRLAQETRAALDATNCEGEKP